MLQHLRWQLLLALVGIVAIGALLIVFSTRRFEVRPARGGQLVEAMVGAPATLNPLLATTESELDLTALLFAGLTRIDASGLARPDLATWTLSEDGRRYRFTLRPGLTWHDGQPVTAEDVMLTAALAADDRIPVPKHPLTAPWHRATARKVDEHSVEIVLAEPYAPFLAAASLGLVPAHVLADVAPADVPRHRFSTVDPVGAGGFRLSQVGGLTPESIQLERFDDYWSATLRPSPYLDALSFQILPTRTAAREALGQRRVQSMGRVPPGSINALGADTRLYNSVEPGYALIYLNFEHAVFSDLTVRQALSLGLDRVGITQDPDLLNGQAIVAVSPIPPGSWAHEPSIKGPAYDPVQARRILEQAGWLDSDGDGIRDRDGRPLAMELAVNNDPLFMGVAERVREDWTALGAETVVQPLDQQSMVNALRNRTHQAVLFGVSVSGADPDPFPLWHSSQVQGGQNFAGFHHPEADRLLAAAREPLPEYPADIAHRRQSYAAFQALFVREQPALMLFHPVYAYAVADPNVGGVQVPQFLATTASRYLSLPEWYADTERVLADSDP